MARLTVRGVVLYQAGPWGLEVPVPGARVEIIDRDTSGRTDDLIWTGTTGPDGSFEGLALEWRDLAPWGTGTRPSPEDTPDFIARISKGSYLIDLPFPFDTLATRARLRLHGRSPSDDAQVQDGMDLQRPPATETYMIVGPFDLIAQTGLLLEQKRRKGYRILIRDVADFGKPPDPDRIREVVLQAKPKYLLLLGDHDATPSYPYRDPETQDRYDSDTCFAMQEGDLFPRAMVGRLSTNIPGELRALCETLVAYPADPSPGWRKRALLSGWCPWGSRERDVDNCGWRCEEEIGPFLEKVREYEHDASQGSGRLDPQRAALWGTADSSLDRLIEQLGAGAVVVSYLGHGDPQGWFNVGRFDGVRDDNLKVEHLSRIQCGDKLPLVLSASCSTGDIQQGSLAEAFQVLRKAIGVFASDTRADTWWVERILPCIYHQIVTRGRRNVGDILLSAMKQVHSSYQLDCIDHMCAKHARFFRYLGDPDTTLAVDEGVLQARVVPARVRVLEDRRVELEEVEVAFAAPVRRAWATASLVSGPPAAGGLPFARLRCRVEDSRVRVSLDEAAHAPGAPPGLRAEVTIAVQAVV